MSRTDAIAVWDSLCRNVPSAIEDVVLSDLGLAIKRSIVRASLQRSGFYPTRQHVNQMLVRV